MAGPLTGILETTGIVVILTLFILMKREDLRNRVLRLAGSDQLNVMTEALDEASQRLGRYLLLQFVVNAAYGLLFGREFISLEYLILCCGASLGACYVLSRTSERSSQPLFRWEWLWLYSRDGLSTSNVRAVPFLRAHNWEQLKIVLGLWEFPGGVAKAQERVGLSCADMVGTSLAQIVSLMGEGNLLAS